MLKSLAKLSNILGVTINSVSIVNFEQISHIGVTINSVSIVNFEQVSHIVLVFSLFNLNNQMSVGMLAAFYFTPFTHLILYPKVSYFFINE